MSAAACKIILDNSALIQGDLTEAICRNALQIRDADKNGLTKAQKTGLASLAKQLDHLNRDLTDTISEATGELVAGMLAGGEPLGGGAGKP